MEEAMTEGNMEEYILQMSEKNPEMAKKMAEYHNSNMADMINNPEKYIQEMRDKNPEMAKKFEEMNAKRMAKMEEMYEAHPEMREMVNEGKLKFEEQTHLTERMQHA